WDVPNESWGVFIDGECWAIWTRRAALRMTQAQVHSRRGPHARPYTAEEVRFNCAKRRGQRPGTGGFGVEECGRTEPSAAAGQGRSIRFWEFVAHRCGPGC